MESGPGQPALRLGLRLVKGLSAKIAGQIVAARRDRGIRDIDQLARRAQLRKADVEILAAAGALQSLAKHRHQAFWRALAIEDHPPSLPLKASQTGDEIVLDAPDEIEDLKADYNSTGLTLGRHPMAILRERFAVFENCRKFREIRALGHGSCIRTAGIVTGRQRPGTASGVVFLTLEDETGNNNIVIWKEVQQRCREALLKSRLLMVKGTVESRNAVVHIIAGELIDCSALLEHTTLESRDFH